MLACACRLKASAKKAAELEKENQKLKGNLSAMNTDLQNKSKEAKKLKERLEEVERENSAVSPIGIHSRVMHM